MQSASTHAFWRTCPILRPHLHFARARKGSYLGHPMSRCVELFAGCLTQATVVVSPTSKASRWLFPASPLTCCRNKAVPPMRVCSAPPRFVSAWSNKHKLKVPGHCRRMQETDGSEMGGFGMASDGDACVRRGGCMVSHSTQPRSKGHPTIHVQYHSESSKLRREIIAHQDIRSHLVRPKSLIRG